MHRYAPDGNAIEFACDGQITQTIPLSKFNANCEGSLAITPVLGAVPPDRNSGL